ncbi:MAG: type II toxin-antitoxin system prevent-host-death family antitoxin [Verrucomicrobiae bacterium]|nr:type II toxin-antitoxin system prevent-host-death family antitoxin [Verrucomicrobiae bacterium]MCP5519946.1 type II toxin-antitoxin system prevent-host-death family antitoxin [Verrucomicrobiales bacterium]
MKTATIESLRNDVAKVLNWVEAGEEVELVQEGTPVAVISPLRRKVAHPDYLARLRATYGNRVLDSQASEDLRDLNRGER